MDDINDILDSILKDNTSLINNKYLIFYVIDDKTNELRRSCYGTIDCCLPTGAHHQETMSLSSSSCELQSDSNEGSN
nr:lef-10 [Pieris rapae granulovirus]